MTHLDLNAQNSDLLTVSADGTARTWRLVPRVPDPPPDVKFRAVRTDIFEQKVFLELEWGRPISFGAPVVQYYILRRRIRKQAIGDKEALNEFPWGHLRIVNVEGNLRDGRHLSILDLKPGNVYQFIVAAESAMGIGLFSHPIQRRMPPAVPGRIVQPKVRTEPFLSVSVVS
mgnify:CR=1 FL=1